MKFRVIFFLCVKLGMVFACNNSNDNDSGFSGESGKLVTKSKIVPTDDSTTTIRIPALNSFPNDGFLTLSFESVFRSINFIPLETIKESLIGNIEKILIYDDFIIILDTQAKNILKFDRSGKFINNIGSVGKGPNEYVNPLDVNIFNNTLYVLDDSQHKIILFDILTGEAIDSFPTHIRFNNFYIPNKDRIYINVDRRSNPHLGDNNYFKLLFADGEFKPVKKAFEYDEKEMFLPVFSRNTFYTYNKNVFYNPALSDYIYKIEENSLLPYYYFDFGHRSLSEKIKSSKTTSKMSAKSFFKEYDFPESRYIYLNSVPIETENAIVSSLRSFSMDFNLFFFKKNERVISSILYSPKFLSNVANSKFLAVDNDKLYGYMTPDKYLELINNKEINNYASIIYIEKNMAEVSFDNNPIIVVAELLD